MDKEEKKIKTLENKVKELLNENKKLKEENSSLSELANVAERMAIKEHLNSIYGAKSVNSMRESYFEKTLADVVCVIPILAATIFTFEMFDNFFSNLF